MRFLEMLLSLLTILFLQLEVVAFVSACRSYSLAGFQIKVFMKCVKKSVYMASSVALMAVQILHFDICSMSLVVQSFGC